MDAERDGPNTVVMLMIQVECFDRLDHDLILKGVKRRVTDGSVLTLIKQFLRSGVMVGGEWEPSDMGSPQGELCKRHVNDVVA